MAYPTNPATGDTYVLGTKSWTYDGTNWVNQATFVLVPGGAGVETGMIMPHTTSTEPAGWLECDGAAISRTTYSDLFAVISDDYGAGDGSTTFNLPDLRGEFIRGFANGSANDADRAGRTNRGDGTTGDVVGSKQSDAIRNISGSYNSIVGSYHSSTLGGAYSGGSMGSYNMSGNHGAGKNFAFSAANQVPTGSDNRPTNVQMMYCIKI